MRVTAAHLAVGLLTGAPFGLPLDVKSAPHGKVPPSHAPAPHVFTHVAAPLPMLPSVARVRIEAARDRVVVLEDVSLPRGGWQSGGLDLFAAFGAPGTPLAVDARLLPVAAGRLSSRVEDAGEPIAVEPAVRHTASTALLLGRASMAGVALHLKDAQLRQVFATADTAALRIRSLLTPAATDPSGARDVVVRLGVDGGLPLTLDEIQVVSADPASPITRAEATLCGPEADPHPLTVAVLPKPVGAPGWVLTVSPALVTRRPSDDLCVRWW